MVYRKFGKRMFDFVSALLLFIVILPIYLILCLLVAIKIGSPIYFKQDRTGMNGRVFQIKKFRSMTEEKDENGNYLPDEVRLTKFGQFLRSSSLDELPELLCIIKGDMSVIGPRPLPPTYDDYYTEEEKARFEVRSGLLPPDSVEEDSIITWDKQLAYESDYARNLSLKKDVHIFFGALKIILQRQKSDYGSFVRKPLNVERSAQYEKV